MDRSRDEDGIRKRLDDIAWTSEKEKSWRENETEGGEGDARSGTRERKREKERKEKCKESEREGTKRGKEAEAETYIFRGANETAQCGGTVLV